MSADRELLELAAKAAGIRFEGDIDMLIAQPGRYAGGFSIYNAQGGSEPWNPLTNNGDALRLAITLGMDINFYPNTGEVAAVQHRKAEIYHRCFERVREDKFAATRRAIVRAAAEIGKAKP